jgi:16S rRNA (adenine(1408)-N(1))-methyltransferase
MASDANSSALSDIAWRATRKPARGGVPNLLCLAEPLAVLSAELGPIADRVSVILPWGSLLRALATPEIDSLRQIARLCLPDATLEIVFSYDSQRDAHVGRAFLPATLAQQHIAANMPGLYEQAGLRIIAADEIPQRQLAEYQTTWAKRLAFGRSRRVWRIQARYRASETSAASGKRNDSNP